MMTNSYLEYFLTLLAWVVNNGLWSVLTSTGLFALPLAFKVLGIWLKVREEGEDEGNKGSLAIVRIENALYGAFVVILFCCVPLMEVSVSTLQFDTSRAKTCGSWTPVKPEASGYRGVVSSLDNQTAKIPLWWMLVHKLSKGVTQAAVASIPCRPDLRQVRFEVQHSNIRNPALAAALQDFTDDCYSRALYDWKAKDQGKTQDENTLQDITWIGSGTFMKGEYHQIQSRTPRAGFPWDAGRDDGYANVNGNGYPTCYQWWNDANAGLLKLVKEQTDEGMWLRARGAMKLINQNSKAFEEAIVRRLVSPANLDVSGGQVYRGYGGNADLTVINGITRMGAMTGTSLASLGAFPAFDTMRQSLPMVQGLMLMAVYIMIPLVLMFSAYEFKTAITVTFVIFALNFLTFWWELARWIDSWMMEALYNSDTHSRWNMNGIQNTSDDVIMNLVMGTMFLVLPALWMGALSWAGINLGSAISNGMKSGTDKATQAGEQGGEVAKNAGTAFMKGVNGKGRK
ncbi:conjugal transfer protein TraG N-terminal domain-containing protein [Proteus mirabilis]|nr:MULTISPECIES: conjugal transfer protein TraG N-terminal domain-containing protein [Enterobacterales]HBD3034289.1 conjugal transfer protein TraG N-terminal domain-containing protein [Citrobacter koseri]EEV7837513.1 conjugal transfer protein TraG [Escherichia coli]EFB3468485.1 conjugal transfer protein TraG [Escherichia coli]EFC1452583.1 conjugal transfer protein TraG [Escherichia coli]EFE7061550.1 conjugal transfer protein TraG [Escherichia coli]